MILEKRKTSLATFVLNTRMYFLFPPYPLSRSKDFFFLSLKPQRQNQNKIEKRQEQQNLDTGGRWMS